MPHHNNESLTTTEVGTYRRERDAWDAFPFFFSVRLYLHLPVVKISGEPTRPSFSTLLRMSGLPEALFRSADVPYIHHPHREQGSAGLEGR